MRRAKGEELMDEGELDPVPELHRKHFEEVNRLNPYYLV